MCYTATMESGRAAPRSGKPPPLGVSRRDAALVLSLFARSAVLYVGDRGAKFERPEVLVGSAHTTGACLLYLLLSAYSLG